MTPEARRLVIDILEEIADGVRKGTFRLDDKNGDTLVDTLRNVLNPQPPIRICSISQACSYLGISQPTFRKYVKCGKIPKGKKIAGITEKVWDKADIERFKKEYRKGFKKHS